MKVKTYSWILAGAYSLCGLALFVAVLRVHKLITIWGISLQPITIAVLTVGPIGWLLLSLAAAVLVVLKDLRFRSSLLNPLFTFTLVSWVVLAVFALLSPFMAQGCCMAGGGE
jgi:hypothetical protein